MLEIKIFIGSIQIISLKTIKVFFQNYILFCLLCIQSIVFAKNLKSFDMKKIKLLFLAVFFPAFMFSQGGAEIVPFAGYMFGGSVKYYEGKLNIQDGKV